MSESGLKAVFLAERAMLLRMLVARLGSPEDAEDVLQDMWLKLDSLVDRPVAQPSAYLFRTAANLASDRRLAAARRTVRDDAWHGHQPLSEELPDAEDVLIARERLRAVEAAVAEMPERMRQAFLLFRVEERPQREIADRLGITVSGVEKLLRRAYGQIQDSFSGDGADGDERRRQDSEGNLF